MKLLQSNMKLDQLPFRHASKAFSPMNSSETFPSAEQITSSTSTLKCHKCQNVSQLRIMNSTSSQMKSKSLHWPNEVAILHPKAFAIKRAASSAAELLPRLIVFGKLSILDSPSCLDDSRPDATASVVIVRRDQS